MSKKRKQQIIEKEYHKKLIKRRKPNRSIAGDIFLYLFLAFVALVMVPDYLFRGQRAEAAG